MSTKSKLRPYRALAQDLGVCERTFHRRLDAGEAKAIDALRRELAWHHCTELSQAATSLLGLAEVFRRTDSNLAAAMEKVAEAMHRLAQTPPSQFRVERDRRLQDLACCEDLSDEDYDRFNEDVVSMPPTIAELAQSRTESLDALTATLE